ncbi:class I SAM-dependent methyltransferase [Polymorphospora sp. NPDC051019]
MSEQFDRAYWEDRYRGHHPSHPHREPNPYLVAETTDLAPGTALEAGCGEGAEAIWLASRGWRVTAVDIAAAALDRAREHARNLGADVADRVEWVRADLTGWVPAEEHFDLVCAHYVHPATPGETLFIRLAAAVVPGGTLLVVGHAPAPARPDDPHAPAPGSHVTAGQVAASLDPTRWDVVVAEARTRTVTGPGGHEMTLHDAVLRARKRR